MNNVLRFLAVFLLFDSVAFCQTAQETTNFQQQRFETNLASGAISAKRIPVTYPTYDSQFVSIIGAFCRFRRLR
jgi:hypothetical protein